MSDGAVDYEAAEDAERLGGWGQVLVGPPGSGKTTYCKGMHELMLLGEREVLVVNLDPANETATYDAAVDVSELIRLEEVMEELDLGPNGAMVYCMEFLEKNVDWLLGKLRTAMRPATYPYVLFDLPGQVEIFTHHESLRNIMAKLVKALDLRLTVVHLVDSFHCSDPSKYISAVFLSLSTMLRLELPHVNVLSKIDLVEAQGELHFGLDFYKDVLDLDYLLPLLPSAPRYSGETSEETAARANEDDQAADKSIAGGEGAAAEAGAAEAVAPRGAPRENAFEERFRKLNGAVCDLIESYSLVAFRTLNIQDKGSVIRLIKHIDKSNGFADVQSSSTQLGRDAPLDFAALEGIYADSMFQ